MSRPRLLDPRDLPESLWDLENGVLRLPPILVAEYASMIQSSGLEHLIDSRDPDQGPVGGISQEESDTHFAQSFAGSVARAQLAFLDPHGMAPHSSDSYIVSFGGEHLALTDAPCGAGAASCAFLCCLAELRSSGVLPRLPLDVALICADLSEPSRKYAHELLQRLLPSLRAQAIFPTLELLPWDVTDKLSNTDLISSMTRAVRPEGSRLLVVANFSAFLSRAGKQKDACPQLEELFRHASGARSVVLWIEPRTNVAAGTFAWLTKLLGTAWRLFSRNGGDANGRPVETEARFERPLHPGQTATVRLAVLPIELVRTL